VCVPVPVRYLCKDSDMIEVKLRKKTKAFDDNVTTEIKVVRTVKLVKRLRRSYRTKALKTNCITCKW